MSTRGYEAFKETIKLHSNNGDAYGAVSSHFVEVEASHNISTCIIGYNYFMLYHFGSSTLKVSQDGPTKAMYLNMCFS